MTTSVCLPKTSVNESANRAIIQEDYLVPHWYATYISPRHEKRVAEQLRGRRVSCFLPLLASVHRWKDRRVRVQLPYFPGYVFVHIAYRDRLPVLQTPGVVRIVGTRTSPAAVPDEQIEALRSALDLGLRTQAHPLVEIGQRVRIRSGPLEGTEGILLRKKGSLRVVVSIRAIMRSFAVEVDEMDIQPI